MTQPVIPTDELRELLADYDSGRRENETYGAYEDRLFNAILRLENLAPFLAAEVLRLREMVEEAKGSLETAIEVAESWIYGQLDGTSMLADAMAEIAPAKATLATITQADERESDRG